MIVYHRTGAAESILDNGFRDTEGAYMTTERFSGVWVSDVPFDVNEGAQGDPLLVIDIPESVIADFEWIEEGKPHREWLVLAETLNRYSVAEAL